MQATQIIKRYFFVVWKELNLSYRKDFSKSSPQIRMDSSSKIYLESSNVKTPRMLTSPLG